MRLGKQVARIIGTTLALFGLVVLGIGASALVAGFL